MIRLSKLTDYGLVLMSYVARSKNRTLHTARDLAVESGLPVPTVSKLLRLLQQGGFLTSHRGIKGGYSLARDAQEISVSDIIAAIEGPVALTDCSTDVTCDFERGCPIKHNQQVINRVVKGALEKLTLHDLVHPLQIAVIKNANGNFIPTLSLSSGRTQ